MFFPSQSLPQPQWLKSYKPTITANHHNYHFVSMDEDNQEKDNEDTSSFRRNPRIKTHQRVSLTIGQQSDHKKIDMFYEIEPIDPGLYSSQGKDDSPLKDFSHLETLSIQESIVVNKTEATNTSQWVKKYQPSKFYELLTDEAHNRNVLSWLKSWDPIVFRKEAPKQTAISSIFNNPNPSSFNKKQQYLSSGNGNGNDNHSSAITSNNSHNKQFLPSSNSTYIRSNTSYALNQMSEYNHNRLLLLSGPPGCGKTTLARVIAKHCGYEIAEINASDDRSAKALITKIEALGTSNSITNNKPTMIIIDEVDGALEHDGANGIKEVLQYIESGGVKNKRRKEKMEEEVDEKGERNAKTNTRFGGGRNKYNSNNASSTNNQQKVAENKGLNKSSSALSRPILFICNDPFVKGLKELRSRAIVVYFRQLQKERVVKRLKQIIEKEKIYIETDVLNKIADICQNDIRSSLGILEYVSKCMVQQNLKPSEVINRLKLSFAKDSNESVNDFLGKLLNYNRNTPLKEKVNIAQFAYDVRQIENSSLLIESFFHNVINFKGFMKKASITMKLYDMLRFHDITKHQSFKYQHELDGFLIMPYLFYKLHMPKEEARKIQFPKVFFEQQSKLKQNKSIIEDLVSKWPTSIRSSISLSTVVRDYLYLLYISVQTSSSKDSEIIECVGKMITYGIELANRSSQHVFKPQFETLLSFGGKKLEINYSSSSRELIQDSYEYAKLRSYMLNEMSHLDINKNTEELMSKLNVKNRRKRNVMSGSSHGVKYKFIEGSGTQITYDLKFGYFF